jgi:hypothetical protein
MQWFFASGQDQSTAKENSASAVYARIEGIGITCKIGMLAMSGF